MSPANEVRILRLENLLAQVLCRLDALEQINATSFLIDMVNVLEKRVADAERAHNRLVEILSSPAAATTVPRTDLILGEIEGFPPSLGAPPQPDHAGS